MGFLCEDNEDGLGDFLRGMASADVTFGCRVNQSDVPIHQCGEGFLAMSRGVTPEQSHVIVNHSPNNDRPIENRTFF
jgi:hypothetical protein